MKKDHEEFLVEILQEMKNATLEAEKLKSLVPDDNIKTNEKERTTQPTINITHPTQKKKGKK